MSSLLNAVAVTAVAFLVLVFIVQSSIAPRILTGSLSAPSPQQCHDKEQWIIYSCQPNAITGIGCIVPNSDGRYITSKNIAVKVSPCQPPPGSSSYSGNRVISLVWQETGEATKCVTVPLNLDCCEYDGTCAITAKFLCVRTGMGEGGENQCLPQFLPAPFVMDPDANYFIDPAAVQIPCRSNFCGAPDLERP